MTNITPAELLEKQKAEMDALRKNQAAERKIRNILGGLQVADARRIAVEVAADVTRIADMSEETRG